MYLIIFSKSLIFFRSKILRTLRTLSGWFHLKYPIYKNPISLNPENECSWMRVVTVQPLGESVQNNLIKGPPLLNALMNVTRSWGLFSDSWERGCLPFHIPQLVEIPVLSYTWAWVYLDQNFSWSKHVSKKAEIMHLINDWERLFAKIQLYCCIEVLSNHISIIAVLCGPVSTTSKKAHLTPSDYGLRNIENELALPKPRTNIFKHSFC